MHCKPLNSFAAWTSKIAAGTGILRKSLFVSLLAGKLGVETGSDATASASWGDSNCYWLTPMHDC